MISRYLSILMFILILLLCVETICSGNEISKSVSLPPIKMSYSDLQRELDKIDRLITTANAGVTPSEYLEEHLVLSAGKTEIKMKGHSLSSSKDLLPKVAYGFSYSYNTTSNAPIADVSIRFFDFSRSLSVEGNSAEQVDALFTTLEKDFLDFSNIIGGQIIRFSIKYVLFVSLISIFILTTIYCIKVKNVQSLGMPIFSLFGLILLITLPLDDILSGFAVYIDNPSFLVRYGSQISFVSLVITSAGILLSFFIPRLFTSAKREDRSKKTLKKKY